MEHALYRLVDDAVSHGQHRLIGVATAHLIQEPSGATLHLFQRFYILGKGQALQVGDIPSCEITPVALAQQRCRLHLGAVRLGYHLTGLDGPTQITGHERIHTLLPEPFAQFFGLPEANRVEPALRLSLHEMGGIVHRLAMSDQIQCCHRMEYLDTKIRKVLHLWEIVRTFVTLSQIV